MADMDTAYLQGCIAGRLEVQSEVHRQVLSIDFQARLAGQSWDADNHIPTCMCWHPESFFLKKQSS